MRGRSASPAGAMASICARTWRTSSSTRMLSRSPCSGTPRAVATWPTRWATDSMLRSFVTITTVTPASRSWAMASRGPSVVSVRTRVGARARIGSAESVCPFAVTTGSPSRLGEAGRRIAADHTIAEAEGEHRRRDRARDVEGEDARGIRDPHLGPLLVREGDGKRRRGVPRQRLHGGDGQAGRRRSLDGSGISRGSEFGERLLGAAAVLHRLGGGRGDGAARERQHGGDRGGDQTGDAVGGERCHGQFLRVPLT